MSTIVDLNTRRWKKYEETLLGKLTTFGRQVCTESSLNHALEQYWGGKGLTAPQFDDDHSFARFFDWFMFDYRRQARSRRVIERFELAAAGSLREEERRLLADWRDARLSIYEVVAVRPGEGLTLVDLFTGERLDVIEREASGSLHKYDLVFTRPLKVFDTYGLSMIGMVIPRSWKRSVEALARYELARFRRHHPDAGWDEFFRHRSHRINRFLVDMFLDRSRPKLRTASGEPLLVCRAWFDVSDQEGATAALAAAPELQRETEDRDADGALRSAAWTWFGGEGALAGSLVLGEIRLVGRRLRLQCLSQERLASGKRLLQNRLGERVRHRVDEFKNPETLGSGRFLPEMEDVHTALSPDVTGLVQQFLQNYYRRWVDEPVPALGGLSPRQACLSREGRVQVVELLKFLENLEEKKKRAGQPYIEVNLIRRELGLPEEE